MTYCERHLEEFGADMSIECLGNHKMQNVLLIVEVSWTSHRH